MSSYYDDSCSSRDEINWLRRQLEGFVDNRVVFFTKGGIHVEGTIRRVRSEFVELIPTTDNPVEVVEVESNSTGDALENFLNFYLRISDIVGFGLESLGD
ncbi:hypothetical protein [Sporosarcina beigongshangi]|uniref:hypothetical protein n=1 Tax=Sporosarcina beigongshangi TaxID=2782538 RepID=UPI00193A69EF|nr:hypothetical protein [Sporosarcina beigongshangi]